MDVIERDDILGSYVQSSSDFERIRSYDLLELGRESRDCGKDME
jgi:hypothetical protein